MPAMGKINAYQVDAGPYQPLQRGIIVGGRPQGGDNFGASEHSIHLHLTVIKIRLN
jgi:hypothetical protein